MHRGPRNDDYACIQWAARAQRSDRIRPSSGRSECSSSSAVSCPTRINSRNAGSCTAGWRFRSYAIVGGPVGQVSAESTSRHHRSTVVERGIAATVVITCFVTLTSEYGELFHNLIREVAQYLMPSGGDHF